MQLTNEQVERYEREGFLLVPGLFSEPEVEVLRRELPSIFGDPSPRRVLESDGKTVRTVNGSHLDNPVLTALTRHPRLLQPARRLLGSETYVYQFKTNAKRAFAGDVWKWHQDFVFWAKDDGLVEPRLVSAVVFLDEVNEFNGPLLMIPGSHRRGVIDVPARRQADQPGWLSDVSADLTYTVSRETVQGLVREHGIQAPKGAPGSVLFFHPNVVHGSVGNISPFDRVLMIVTYNSVENLPREVAEPRPEFLVGRFTEPLAPLPDDVFLSARAP